jgi:hypothetical protein
MTNMPRYYLHVEAVNLAHTVYDTYDIITIRGGSFILLDAVEELADHFSGRLQPITSAASQGLFAFEAEAGDEAGRQRLLREVLSVLNARTGGHATFLAAIEPEIQDGFPLVLERLAAQIRRLQWRMPTVAVPDFAPTAQECFIDGWRPGVHPYRGDPAVKGAAISDATQFRRDEGRKIKHRLFYRLLGDEKYRGNLCAKDLGELALDPHKGILSGKIAFIHVDGNSFGRIRRALCTTPDLRGRFDRQIQDGCRKPFLKALLQRAEAEPDFRTVDESGAPALRIEVLLWGGDEMTLVVPAWKGLEVIELFFQHARQLAFDGVQLSHRAAIVFCHHNAPILQIRRLAEDALLGRTRDDIQDGLDRAITGDPRFGALADQPRSDLRARLSDHPYGNALHYLVLESFDTLGGSFSSFLGRYYKGIDYAGLMLYAGELGALRQDLRTVQAAVPKGKVLEIVKALRDGGAARVDPLRHQLLASAAPGRVSAVEAALHNLVGENSARWALLADLWDYIPEWNA